MMHGIYSAMARWDDEAALRTLFSAVSEPIVTNIQKGRAKHPDGFSGMRHDAGTDRAFYVIADADHVQVWTLVPCSFEEAAEIWSLLDKRPVTTALMMRAYKEATGHQTEYVQ